MAVIRIGSFLTLVAVCLHAAHAADASSTPAPATGAVVTAATPAQATSAPASEAAPMTALPGPSATPEPADEKWVTTPLTDWQSSSGEGPKVELKLRLREGQTFEARTSSTTTFTSIVQGRKYTRVFTVDSVLHFEVTMVDGVGQTFVALTTTPYLIRATFNGRKNQYRAGTRATKANTSLRNALLIMRGVQLTLMFSPDGCLRDVQGGEELVRRAQLIGPNPGYVQPGASANAAADLLTQVTYGNVGGYPTEPVAVGDVWKSEFDGYGIFGATRTTSVLRSRRGGRAVIGFTASSGFSRSDAIDDTFKGRMLVQGWYEIDEATGWPLSAVYNYRGAGAKSAGDDLPGASAPMKAYIKGGLRQVTPGQNRMAPGAARANINAY